LNVTWVKEFGYERAVLVEGFVFLGVGAGVVNRILTEGG
jgi:hypothetical protein